MNRTVSLIYVVAFVLLSLPAFSQATEASVYITRTGEKYHASTCRYLKYSSKGITKSDADERGYTPCSVSGPGGDQRSSVTLSGGTYQKGQTASRQCTGTTQSGQRCRRMTTSANGRCYQH